MNPNPSTASGAISIAHSATGPVIIRSSQFLQNSLNSTYSAAGGALHCGTASFCNLFSVQFLNNSVTTHGTFNYQAKGAAAYINVFARLENSVVAGNTVSAVNTSALNMADAAWAMNGKSASIKSTSFLYNTASVKGSSYGRVSGLEEGAGSAVFG